MTERTWSPDQKISRIDDEKIRIIFSASSDVELIAWILSFGDEAKVKEPEWVAEEVLEKSKKTVSLYE